MVLCESGSGCGRPYAKRWSGQIPQWRLSIATERVFETEPVRVAANCALCHAASYRSGPDATPEVVAAVPGHTVDLQPLLTFLKQCARDPRFNANELLAAIDMATELSFLDRLTYRFILIPRTRQALLDQNSVILDSKLDVHSQNPGTPFSDPRLKAFEDWVKNLRAPAYPLPVNSTLALAGKSLFAQHCASCHAIDPADKTRGKVYLISEIGTDRTFLDEWTQALDKASAGTTLDSERQEMVKAGGYIAPPLRGIWLRGLRRALRPRIRLRASNRSRAHSLRSCTLTTCPELALPSPRMGGSVQRWR